MKIIILMFFILSPFLVLASESTNLESILTLDPGKKKTLTLPKKIYSSKKVNTRKKKNIGNIKYKRTSKVSLNSQNLIIFPEKTGRTNLLKLFNGDHLKIAIKSDLIAYKGSKIPVTASILSKSFSDYLLVGVAEMDKRTKRVCVNFNFIRKKNGENAHRVSATLHDNNGAFCFKGRHETEFWSYYWANVFSHGVEGYAKSLTEKERSIYGVYDENSPQNAVKKAMASAAQSSTKLLADELKNYPEFTYVVGPIVGTVQLTSTPEFMGQ